MKILVITLALMFVVAVASAQTMEYSVALYYQDQTGAVEWTPTITHNVTGYTSVTCTVVLVGNDFVISAQVGDTKEILTVLQGKVYKVWTSKGTVLDFGPNLFARCDFRNLPLPDEVKNLGKLTP